MATNIQPILSLKNIVNWNETNLPIWPLSGNIEITNDTEINLDLSSLTYLLNYENLDNPVIDVPFTDLVNERGATIVFSNGTFKDNSYFGSGDNRNGIGKWMIIPDKEFLINSNWTLSLFSFSASNEAANSYGTAILATNNDAYGIYYNDGYQLYLDGSTGSGLKLKYPGPPTEDTETIFNIDNYIRNDWNHIALTYDNSTKLLTAYVNGNLSGAVNITFPDNSKLINFLNYNSTTGYTSKQGINDLTLWDSVLSESVIKSLAAKEIPTDYIVSTFKPLKVEVNWGDNTTSEYFYNITTESQSSTWLRDLQNWLQNIGPHRYNFLNNDIGNKNIIIKIFDSSGNVFGFKILLDILSQSIYNLNLEIDIKKAVFNSETASVVFKLDTVGDSIIENTKIPVVSILN